MNLNTKKTADLREMAEKQEIEGWETLERKELIEALKPKEEPKPEKPEEKEEIALEEFTMKELQKMAKKKGVNIKGLKTKKDVAEAIKKKDEKGEEPEVPPEAPGESPSPEVEGIEGSRTAMGSKARIMKAKLAKQKKITILIPLDKSEKPGGTMSVILNDFRMNIMKGVYVPVPEQVAKIIMKSQKQTIAALRGPTVNPQSGEKKDSRLDGSEKELQ